MYRLLVPYQGIATGGRRTSVYYSKEGLGDKVELGGTFCMGKCQQGVCVTVDDNFFSVTPDTVKEFFDKEIKAKV